MRADRAATQRASLRSVLFSAVSPLQWGSTPNQFGPQSPAISAEARAGRLSDIHPLLTGSRRETNHSDLIQFDAPAAHLIALIPL
jgi:hypothetical protein